MTGKRRRRSKDVCTEESCPAIAGEQAAPLPTSCECGRNAEYAAVLASTLDPLVTIDSYGVILSASNSVERVFGWQPAALVGQNVSIFTPEPHRSQHDTYLANYRRTLITNILGRTREFEAVRRDGTRFPIELSVSRADVPGQSLPLFVGVIRDISERKRIEQELEAHRQNLEQLVRERTRDLEATHEQLRITDRLAAIGTLAAGLGHDMNNVLLPVRARLNALDSMSLSTEAHAHLEAMRKSCSYLQQLSDGLHMLALNPDEVETVEAVTDVHEWLSTVGAILTKAAPKGVRFATDIEAGLPRVPLAPHKLTQAVLNLIVNAGEAIQSMPRRSRHASIRLWAHASHRGREVHLGVTDNGPGMTPDIRARALDAFFTTKKRGLGTGLGLSLVRGVVLSAGGEIDIATQEGKGTEIVLTLPAVHGLRGDPDAGGHTAVIYLPDRRAASMAAHILEAAEWRVRRSDEPTLDDASLWVIEPSAKALAAAKKFLQITGRAIVVVGQPRSRRSWTKLGAWIADEPHDFDSLRDAIGNAIRHVEKGASS